MRLEEELKILYDIIEYELEVSISSTQDLQEILDKTLALAGRIFQVERASIMLFDEERRQLITRAEWSPDGKKFGLSKVKYGEGVAGWVIKHGIPYLYNGKEENSIFIPSPKSQVEVKTLLSLPMQIGSRKIGVLNVGSINAERSFSPAEIKALKLLASRAALAVENAGLVSNIIFEKEKLENIVRYLGEGVITVDKERKITLINEAAQNITGWKANEVVGKFCGEIFETSSPAGLEKCQKHCPLLSILKYKAKPKRGFVAEGSILTKSGSKKYVLSSFSTLIKDNELGGGIIVFRDITEEKKLEQLRSDLLAGFSHDLRTPLAAIKGHILTLLRLGKKMEETERLSSLQIVNSEVDRLNRSLDNLVSLFRIQTNKLILYPDYFEVKASVEKTISLFKPSASKHSFSLKTSGKNFMIRADQDKIEQVLSNLISNAIKYSPGGKISIALEDLGEEIKLTVQDEGVGISKEELPKIFKSYSRGKQTLLKAPGSGLGLFISKAIIEAHHGKLWVEPQERGSRFCFTLPKGVVKNEKNS
jgi:PAS domain S-box-containing protein